jgi:bacillithiol synthase
MMQVPFGKLPGMTGLFLDYTSWHPPVRRFYPHEYTIEAIVRFAAKRRDSVLPHRAALCDILAQQQRSRGASAALVDKLAGGAVAVMTGQQPGLFTGPLYTILKAITAIKLARTIEDAGIAAVPVFWAAAEDHDYEEIQWASVLDRDSALRRFQVDLANDEGTPAGWLRFKRDVADALNDCLATLPASEFQAELRDMLETAYRPGVSPVEAFARMMTRLFAAAQLIVADPLDPRMKEIAAPVLARVAGQNESIRRAVLERSRAVADAGYHEQVRVDASFTGLFTLQGNSRRSLKPEQLSAAAGMLSPNVLVRPAVQDTIFPTAAFIAGPSEIAYLAQSAAVYESLGSELPPVFPRISATVVESRVAKSMKKYDLQFADVFQGKDFIKRRAVENVQGTETFARAREELVRLLESLRPALAAVDPTLLGALDNAKQKMVYQVEGLETRFINAEAKRNDLMEKHLEAIANSLFPEKKLQERQLNVTSFVGRYGSAFLKHLENAVSLNPSEHQIVEL